MLCCVRPRIAAFFGMSEASPAVPQIADIAANKPTAALDRLHTYCMKKFGHLRDSWLEAARLIRQGVRYSNSIDSFIDTHKDNEKVQFLGKLAIAATILEAERESHLYVDDTATDADFKSVGDVDRTWFVSLFRSLSDGVRKPEVNRIFERVSFVVFNYDRCIEHFFYIALQKKYGIDPDAASSVMGTLKISHPYGTISPLKWQSPDGIPYGFTTNRANLIAMEKNIKTYTEQVQDTTLMKKIHDEISVADTIVFLGFSYHPENMRLLRPGVTCNVKRLFGTAYGISDADRNEVIRAIWDLVQHQKGEIQIIGNMKCAHLLEHFSRSLFR